MKTFNQEQLEVLSEYEDRFRTAVSMDYYRNLTSRTLDKINEVYAEVNGTKHNSNWSCGHCVLSFLKTVGSLYFKSVEALDEAEAAPISEEKQKEAEAFLEVLDEIFEEVDDEAATVPDEAPVEEEKPEEPAQVVKEPEPKPEKDAPVKKTNNKATKKK